MTIGPNQKPPPHPIYGDNWERGKDPWHVDAFPSEFKPQIRIRGERKEGWFLLDAWKNEIAFVADGTELIEHEK